MTETDLIGKMMDVIKDQNKFLKTIAGQQESLLERMVEMNKGLDEMVEKQNKWLKPSARQVFRTPSEDLTMPGTDAFGKRPQIPEK